MKTDTMYTIHNLLNSWHPPTKHAKGVGIPPNIWDNPINMINKRLSHDSECASIAFLSSI